MLCPLLIFKQSEYLIQVAHTNSNISSQTKQIQISWLPTDLDLHCLQRQGISGFNRTRVNIFYIRTDGLHHAKNESLGNQSIYTVWSGPSLSINRIVGYYRMCDWRAKTLILCACAGWPKSVHSACLKVLCRLMRPRYVSLRKFLKILYTTTSL